VNERAKAAKGWGVRRFCIVTSGKGPAGHELEKIAEMVSEVKEADLLPCATLGLLDEEALRKLKDAGLHRYHHNLETSRRFFPEVCRSHTYDDKLKTIEAVKKVGLSLCSGGIFGLGEDWEDRV
ncbi:MAG: radical SAM protein, partial [Armatimonadetes bacterium]|nr:radical SAM protein [Armatimonadota bacterium]NIO97689.1 radical SAM protein [Armatimonadota bacterium]